MTPLFRLCILSVLASLLLACGNGAQQPPPPPQAITLDAVGYFCSMNLVEHDGPKAQIFIRDKPEPLWFSTVRQALAYNIMPDMPKGIAIIYVHDMSHAQSDTTPDPDAWTDARTAHFVINSRLQGGMGGDDAFPFSNREAAERFVSRNGGTILGFSEIPEDYILNYESSMPAPSPTETP